jgi:hypothetical protein
MENNQLQLPKPHRYIVSVLRTPLKFYTNSKAQAEIIKEHWSHAFGKDNVVEVDDGEPKQN